MFWSAFESGGLSRCLLPSARQAEWFQAFLVLNYTGPMELYNLKTYAIKGYILSMVLVFLMLQKAYTHLLRIRRLLFCGS